MIEKKFRGFCYEFGNFVYGKLSKGVDYYSIEGIDEDYGDYMPDVDTETIAQLIGYDANGAEVYEGDTLVDKTEKKYVATIQDNPDFIATLNLKEDNETLLLKKFSIL